MTRYFLGLASFRKLEPAFLDIDRLFVQQLEMLLDGSAEDRYIANRMANRRKGEQPMNRFRVLAIATILIFVLAAVSQQSTLGVGNPAQEMSGEHASVPTAETQLKFLTGKLDLTSAQQEKIKPVLQELHAASVKLVQDEGLSHDERLSKIRDSRYAADKRIRAILSDDQKAKLDQVEKEPHPELHGSVSGTHN